MDIDDGELLERSSRRDEQAQVEFYRRHAPGMIKRLAHLTGDPDAAEELAHNVLHKLMAKPFTNNGTNPLGYIARAVTNEFRDWNRAQRRHGTAEEFEDVDIEPGTRNSRFMSSYTMEVSSDDYAERRADALVRWEEAMGAIQAFPSELRLIIHLVGEGWSYEDIADNLGKSKEAVKQQVYRMREALRARHECELKSGHGDAPDG